MRGDLVHSRVVDDPGSALAVALDRALTGYAVLDPAGALLFDEDDRSVIVLENGAPIAAHHRGTDRGGADAVAEIARAGPYRVALYETVDVPAVSSNGSADDRSGLPSDVPSEPSTPGSTAVVPGEPVASDVPAEVLAGDPSLAERTRAVAPDRGGTPGESPDALAAFLENEEKIAAIQEHARTEARRRAAEWGLDDLADGSDVGGQ